MHPDYKRSTRHNDIALIKLRYPVASSSSVGTICLSTSDDILANEFTITGFGRTNVKGKLLLAITNIGYYLTFTS